jgi:hypothetical protein
MLKYDRAMFGHGRRISMLETRADEHEAELATLGPTLAAALRRAVDEMSVLRERLDASVRGEAERAPRVFGELGRTYRAEWTGYVCLYFDGGYHDRVELRVGDSPPPTTVVCTLNSRNDLNSYAGCVVRRSEHWLATSSCEDGHSGVRCVFTPFA